MGVFDYDTITTTNDDDDEANVVPTIMIPRDGAAITATGKWVSPISTTDIAPTPSLSLSYNVTIPPLPNPIYDVSDGGLDIDVPAPMVVPHVEDESLEFFCKNNVDDEDASLFAGFINGNDDDMDGSSIIAVDELLSLDRMLGLDSSSLDIDNDWL